MSITTILLFVLFFAFIVLAFFSLFVMNKNKKLEASEKELKGINDKLKFLMRKEEQNRRITEEVERMNTGDLLAEYRKTIGEE